MNMKLAAQPYEKNLKIPHRMGRMALARGAPYISGKGTDWPRLTGLS